MQCAERARVVTRRLALGMLAAALLLAVPAAPARADHYEVTWSTPSVNESLQGARSLEFEVASVVWLTHGKVREWRLEVVDAQGVSKGVLCAEDYGPAGDDAVPVELVWDTRFYPGPSEPSGACDNTVAGSPALPGTPDQFSANGDHRLRVWVRTNATLATGSHEETFERMVKLDNAPQSPTGATASFDAAAQRIDVRWNANVEPDVTGYAVDECVKAAASQACEPSDWSRVANPLGLATTSAGVPVTRAGAHRYRVAAVRPHADASDFFSPASQTEPVVLEAGEVEQTPTTVGDGGTGGSDTPGTGGGSGGDDPGDGGTGGSDPDPGDSETARSGGAAGGTRGLPDRLIERTEVDAGYEEALPYGAKPLDEAGGDALHIAAKGIGLALVPIAGGLVLFVFAMQMRYLSRRADGLALAADAPEPGADADVPVPLFRLGAGGSFISNWKRLLDEPGPPPGD